MVKTKYLIIMSILVSAVLVGITLSFPATAATVTPDTYKVTLYKTELSTNGTTWVEVFNSVAGTQIDFQNAAQIGSAFGQGSMPEGTYNAARFTIKNAIEYSYAASGVGATTFSPYPGNATDQVPVYFSVSGTFTWSNDGSTLLKAFPMPDPIRVVANGTSKVIMNFGVTNSLVIVGATLYLAPPTMSVSNIVIPPTPPANPNLFAGGEYYFVRQNLAIPALNSITPTWMELQSGWGIISMSAPSAAGVGTFEILPANNSEHRRSIYLSDAISHTSMGGQIELVGIPMSGTYYADASGFINMLMPQTNGIIRGGLRNDGKVFIAIEIASPSSQTQDTYVGYHMIYAILKETNTNGPNLIGDFAFNGYGAGVITAYNTAGGATNYQNFRLETDVGIGWLQATAGAVTDTETNNRIEIQRPLSPTEQTVTVPTIGYYTDTNAAPLAVDANCRFTVDKTWGALLNDRSIGIYAGDTTSPSDTWSGSGVEFWQNYLNFGVALPISPAGTFNVASVSGTYTFVFRRDKWDNSMGTELPDNEVTLGRITLDGVGNATGRMTVCRRGATEIQTFDNITYTVVTTQIGALSATAVAGVDYRSADVISLYDNDKQEEMVRMLIGADGKTLSPYVPAETVPFNNTPSDRRGLGLAIKQ
ncbi:MAG: hypothetical protein HY811_01490 [Planctomycetes bacterium]|nr:hypothetical protein [Planctomycetota bacterium]